MRDTDTDWLCLNCQEWNLGKLYVCSHCKSKVQNTCTRFNPNTGQILNPQGLAQGMSTTSSNMEFEGIKRGDWKCP